MDADQLIELLRQFADCLVRPDLERNPLAEIERLGEDAVPMLVEALAHEDPLVRRMAVCALGCLYAPGFETFDLRPAVPRLRELLRSDPDSLTRLYAAEAMWMICEDRASIRVLVGGLRDDSAEARRYAAAMLGAVGQEARGAIGPLVDALDDPDVLVRRSAAESLAIFGPAAAAALPKLALLLDEDEWTRVIGVEAILRIDPDRAEEFAPLLVAALQSAAPRIRHSAAHALGEFPAAGRIAVPALVEALDDEEELVRMGVLWALEQLGPAAAPATTALVAIVQGTGMDGDDSLVRGMAACALAEIGPEARAVTPDLLQCLHSEEGGAPTTRLRLQVAGAVWKIARNPRPLVTIGIEALDEDNWRVRRLAAQLLGELGPAGESVVPRLRQASNDGHPTVRRQAADSLERITGVSVA